MPISRKEFERGEPDPGLFVIDFFRSNSDYAFTVEELMDGLASKYTLKQLMSELMSKGVVFAVEDLQEMLDSLVERGRIESNTVSGVVYYGYRETIGF